jgi:PKD repeat protein
VTVDDTTPAPGQSVAFSVSASNDTDGQIVSYEWDFDDGSTATGENATHTFSSLGTYNVTLTVTDNGGATASETVTVTVREPGPTVALEPAEQEVSTGGTEAYELVVRGADNGVASYEFDLASSNTSVAAISSVDVVGTDPSDALTDVTVASNGSSASITVGTASISATGNVTIATVDVDIGTVGTATLSPSNVSVGDTSADTYTLDSVDDATLEAIDRAPALVGGRPAQNLDGDDTYEDTNGDGTFNIVDVNALFQNRNSQTVQDNVAAFDFNGDGSFNIVDVNALFQQVLG